MIIMTIFVEHVVDQFKKNMNDFYSSFSSETFLQFYLTANSYQLYRYNVICDYARTSFFNLDTEQKNPVSYDDMQKFNNLVGDFFEEVYITSFKEDMLEVMRKIK